MQSIKKDPQVQLDASGTLKLNARAKESSCAVTTHFDLLSAWRRRSLALDLARLANFQEIEGWVQHLFAAQQRTQPQGYAQITLDQIIETDRQLWIRLCSRRWGRPPARCGAQILAPRPRDPSVSLASTQCGPAHTSHTA